MAVAAAQVELMVRTQGPLLLAAMEVCMALAAAVASTPRPAACRVLVALEQFALLHPEPLGSFQVRMFRALALGGLCCMALRERFHGLFQLA